MIHKRLLPALSLSVLLCLLLSGCFMNTFSDGDSKKMRQQAEAIFQAYLDSQEPGGEITGTNELSWLNPDTYVFELTDYVQGTYQVDGMAYDFAVDTVSETVFTSRRFEEFVADCGDYLMDAYGLQASNLDVRVALTFAVMQPSNTVEPVVLLNMLPADVTDMRSFVAEVLADKSYSTNVDLLYTGDAIDGGVFFGIDTSAAQVNLYRLPDGRAADLPELDAGYAACFAEESATVSQGSLDYTRWGVVALDGLLIQMPLQRISPAGAFSVEPETDFQAAMENGVLRIRALDSIYGYLLVEDLSKVDGVQAVAMQSRVADREAYNLMPLQPVLDRYILSDSSLFIPFKIQDGDVIVPGLAGQGAAGT